MPDESLSRSGGGRTMEERPILQPRLRSIADSIPASCRRVADIGTDHGYIPVELLLTGRADFAIAADIGAEPLAHAERTAARCGITEGIDFRLGDGLAVLRPHEADCVVIAGMGGDNIVSILQAAAWTKTDCTLLLQPMSKSEILRAWLPENGYRVIREQLVADKGVIYPILTVTGGAMPAADPAQAYGGFLLQEDPLWGDYLDHRILRLRRAAAGLERARDSALAERRALFAEIIGRLTEWKGEWLRANGT